LGIRRVLWRQFRNIEHVGSGMRHAPLFKHHWRRATAATIGAY
jgi:hypothetical protein